MEEGVISIIVPIYNAGKVVDTCIKSLIDQIGKFEIILIDDGSQDNSWDICVEAEKNSPLIRAYRQKNAGVSAARNYGLSVAKGQFILFVDSDDSLPGGTIQKYMEHNPQELDLIIGSYRKIGRGVRKIIHKETLYMGNEIIAKIAEFDKLISTPWGRLYQREIIDQNGLRFDEGHPYGEDHLFNLKYCEHVRNCAVISDIVYNYRVGGFASSIKYHSNMNVLNKNILQGYIPYYCMTNDDFFKKRVRDQFIASIMHYLCCCKKDELLERVEETIELYEEYLTEEYIGCKYFSEDEKDILGKRNAEELVKIVRKKNWKRLYAKRIKRSLVLFLRGRKG